MKHSYVKSLWIIIFMVCSLNLFAQYPAGSPVAINGKLKITGNKMQSECGNNVQLRGMSSHGLQWTENCMNGSFDVLATDWKIDILRLAMYVNETGYATNPTKWKVYLDNMVDECGRRGIYCLIDWHVTTPGDPNADIGIARDFWTYMATKHKGKKHVLYEICNEPSGVDWTTVKRYADDIIPRIRAIDASTIIIVGNPEWSSRPEQAAANKLSYTNIAYSLHFYAGESAHSAYRSRGDQALAAGACVFVTEFGTSPASGTGSINTGETGNWMTWMKSNNVSWCNWSYSDIAETSAALTAGSCAAAAWNNTTPSGTYIKGQLTSSDAFTNCNTNIVPPTVSISSPVNNTSFMTNVVLTATATPASGSTITKVDFYATTPANVTTLIGTVTGAPYTFNWNNAPLGTYVIKAVGTASTGVTGTSAGVTIFINVAQAPYTGTAYPIPGKIEAENYDIGGNMNAYYDNTIGNLGNASSFRPTEHVDVETTTDGGAGYNVGFTAAGEWMEYAVNVTATNRYTINFRVASGATTTNSMRVEMDGTTIGTITTPANGVWTTFQTISVTNVLLTAGPKIMRVFFVTGGINLNYVEYVASNTLPTISITAPATNTTFPSPSNITFTATAADAGGSINKVEFYNGTTLLGPATGTYAYTWSNVAAGTYTITAKATDNSGGETISSPITVIVSGTGNTLPVVSLTAPANNATFTAPATVALTATASDADGIISKVEFYNGTTLLGSSTSSPYSYTWANVAAGTYTFSAKATDNSGGVSTSTTITVVVNPAAGNIPPTVSLTNPVNNASFTAPANITINANAADSDGTISSVEFYSGSTLLGTDATSPYNFVWSNVAAGTYTLTARATDNGSSVTTSTAITVVVNSAPAGFTLQCESACSVDGTLNESANAGFRGTGYVNTNNAVGAAASWSVNSTSAQTVSLDLRYAHNTATGRAMSLSVNGTTQVANIPFAGTGSGTTWVISTVQVNLLAGANTVRLVSLTADGSPYLDELNFASSTVSAGTCSITTNTAPTVSITSPVNNAAFTAPASITINANAADADGTISSVAFYNGSTLLGTDPASPFSFVWSNVAAGTYNLTARATDNGAAVTTSAAITVVVNTATNTPPTVNITSPSNNASFTAPANITINATAADANGTISSVAFYNGATLLGSDATSPYSFVLSNVVAGTYTLTAKATDNGGSTTTSSAITVVVNGTPPTGVTIQCESACSVDGTLNESANAGFRGTGYVNTNNAVGAAASWSVNSTSAQTVSLDIRYAHNTATGRAMSLSVNGITQAANIPFASTGSGITWVISTVQINLLAGANSVRLVSLTSDGSPYLDELTFASSTVSAGTCTTTTNTAPTVSITNPASNAAFTAPANITINANAADADGTISSVAFYNGSTLLGSNAATPYSFTWNNVPAGTYSITARASDNGGAVTTSTAITVVVNGATPAGVTIQCETACSVDGVLNESANAGFRGTGYVNTNNAVGASASWAVNSLTAQTVSLGIRYATATTTGRPMSLSVNGVLQVSNIPFPNTGGSNVWATVNVQINLSAGVNNIHVASLASIGSPYLDELVFNGADISAGSCAASAPQMATVVGPNPSANGFTFTAIESIQSFVVIDNMGQIKYTGGALAEGETVTFGQSLGSGLYMLHIYYSSGRVESIKILKTL